MKAASFWTRTGLIAVALAGAAALPAWASSAPNATAGPTSMAHDPAACQQGTEGAAIRVAIEGLRDRRGLVRLQLYSDDPRTFLEKGKRLARIEVPAETGTSLCMPLPGPGRFALYVLHDRAGNRKADPFSDGFGFSNNPRLRMSRPDVRDVAFDAPAGVSAMTIRINYIGGNATAQR